MNSPTNYNNNNNNNGWLSRVQRFQICLVVSAFLVLFSMEREMMMSTTSGMPPEDVDIKNKKNTTKANVPTGAIPAIPGVPSQPPPPPTTSGDNAKPATTPTTTTTPAAPITSPTFTIGTKEQGQPQTTPSDQTKAPAVAPVSSPLSPLPPPSVSPPSSSSSSASASFPPPPPSPPMSNSSLSFVNQHCDINPLKTWYPESKPNSTDDASWQLRAPYVILAGVWNAGIHDVAKDLSKTDIFTNSKMGRDSGFFLPKQFYRFQIRDKTKVYGARQRMYAQLYNTKALKDNPTLRYIDISPGYLFYPKTIYPILCVAPWTKFIVVLKNPVERLYKQWVYGRVHLQLTLSLEDWMARDMKIMQSVGLLSSSNNNNNGNNNNGNLDINEERQAWNRYQTAPLKVSGAIGRSMYVLQLQEWFDAIQSAGKDPKDVMYIVPSEALLGDNSAAEYSKLFDFLGTPSSSSSLVTSSSSSSSNSNSNGNSNSNNNVPPMSDETKQMLQGFFAPYNERLANMLGNDFGDYDWKNIWKE